MTIHCKNCRFFVTGQVMGACRRYPELHNKHEMDWCGEYQEQHVQMVKLPVYDITTDETKTADVPVERKKPGRKPKNANSPAA